MYFSPIHSIMDKKTIIQWNCRGLRANYNEILILMSLFSPSVICLQETFLKQSDNISFRDFNMFNYGRYKVRKEPSPAKRCEKSGKGAKRAVLWKKNRLCHIELDFDRTGVIKINVSELQIFL